MKEKKIIINLVPIFSGGGLQNALNLIEGLGEINKHSNDFLFVFRENEILISTCKKFNFDYITIKNNLLSRFLFETLFFLKRRAIVFTLFGGKPLFTYANKNIVGCAYSNLFYPEIDFWGYLPWYKKALKKVKDKYRIILTKKANIIIFETNVLAKRASEILKISKGKVRVVKMAVSKFFLEKKDKKNESVKKYLVNLKECTFKILYLGSAHPNKRQYLLPYIAKKMYLEGCRKFCFITTMEKIAYTRNVLDVAIKEGVQKFIHNIGRVPPKDCPFLIEECDAMINLAKLESFSNNFVEAWTMKKPLIVTDADWSRSICGPSALYVNPNNFSAAAKRIIRLIQDREKKNKLIEEGSKQILSYPNYKEKASMYLDIINELTEVIS